MALSQVVDHTLDGLGIAERRELMNVLMAEIRARRDALRDREVRVRALAGPESSDAPVATDNMIVSWEATDLTPLNPYLAEDLADLAQAASPLLEKATEFSGYALAICAIHAYLPNEKVYAMNQGQTPNLWLDIGRNRGIEVAARAVGGRTAFKAAISSKRAAVGIATLDQGYISVWGLDMTMGHKELVIPHPRQDDRS